MDSGSYFENGSLQYHIHKEKNNQMCKNFNEVQSSKNELWTELIHQNVSFRKWTFPTLSLQAAMNACVTAAWLCEVFQGVCKFGDDANADKQKKWSKAEMQA